MDESRVIYIGVASTIFDDTGLETVLMVQDNGIQF